MFISVSLTVVSLMSWNRACYSQDGSLGRVARRDSQADDDFLPLPESTELEDETSWWSRLKPTMPKFQAPQLTMPRLQKPKAPAWVKKANQNTRQAMVKTKEALISPWQSFGNSNEPRRTARQREKSSFWSRMFSADDEPRKPTTVAEFLQNPRPEY
jgi:hypothetical protein